MATPPPPHRAPRPPATWSSAAGEPNRLTYGVDSYGFTCGTTNTYQNVSFDLTDSKNLYYLNPLELLDVTTLLYAKKVCSAGCPTVTCGRADFPCTNNSQYV